MKILFVIGSLDAGGTETYLLRFINFLKYRHKVFVLCTSGVNGSLSLEYEKAGAVIYNFRQGVQNPFLWVRFLFFLIFHRFDVICDFNGNFSGINIFIAYLTRHKKRITFYRQTADLFNKKFLFFFSMNKITKSLVFKYSTRILSNSQMAFDAFFKGKCDSRFKVIYNGLDPMLFDVSDSKKEIRKDLNLPLDAFIVGHTARYHPVKNHITILDVAEIICPKYPNIYFVLCGRNLTKKLNDEIFKRKLNKRVLIFDGRSDIPRVLKSFDMYYFPSYSEGQPNSLIEAMFANLPIVVSNIPCVLETIPPFLFSQAIDPFDVQRASELIVDVYKGKYQSSLISDTLVYMYKNFDKDIRFSEFENELI